MTIAERLREAIPIAHRDQFEIARHWGGGFLLKDLTSATADFVGTSPEHVTERVRRIVELQEWRAS